MNKNKLKNLEKLLVKLDTCIVAVSGGVDSMTLAYVANKVLGKYATIVHSISPAVPDFATNRIKKYSKKYNWNLILINSGEMEDENYLNNPYNRCLYCKKNLYSTIRQMFKTDIIFSGTNFDDLDDFRPGLKAAKLLNVRHPFVECKIDKNYIRSVAHYFDLSELGDLPSSPCLSSRIETGLKINSVKLIQILEVEKIMMKKFKFANVRCRIRKQGAYLEIDDIYLKILTEKDKINLSNKFNHFLNKIGLNFIDFTVYKKGSAFINNF